MLRIDSDDKPLHTRIALTFDDGPHPKHTESLIKTLSERILPATFFVLGTSAKRWPNVVKYMHQAGHEIGNHGWSHSSFAGLTDSEIVKELQDTHQLIRSLSEQECAIYRPPYGTITQHQQKVITAALDYRLSLWNVDSLDWRKPTVDDLVHTMTTFRVKTAILLFHDFSTETREALPRIIDTLMARDCTFYTASRILSYLRR
jgi:peptidoglycan-N-acetylglucosamine deacetylase